MDDTEIGYAVGRALGAMRRRRGVTQSEVAYALGKSQVTVSNWENGQRTPDVRDLTNYAAAVGTTPAQVLSEAETDMADEFTSHAVELVAKLNEASFGRRKESA